MKLSKYNVNFSINDDQNIIFNTYSRKYIIYDKRKKIYIDNLLKNLKKKSYELEEFNILQKLIKKGIVISDDFDEFQAIKYKEQSTMYQDQYFKLTIQPTLSCNFRCVYCYEKHKNISMNNITIEKVLKFINNITKKVNKLIINWFGGEPLLKAKDMIIMCKKIKLICEENNCFYESALITNGYLLSDEIIVGLKELNLRKIQITVDGIEDTHNATRFLSNGEGTFKVILNNLYKTLEYDIRITLRVNICENNYNDVEKLFQLVPKDKRNKVIISLANIFQNKTKIDLYPLYKKAINMGYSLGSIFNSPDICEGAVKNSLLIDPEGKITSCAMAAEKGIYFGYLNDDGDIVYNNVSNFYKLRNILSTNQESCSKCIKLPVCFGGCKLNREKFKNVCNWGNPTGMTLENRIKLKYLQDKSFTNVERDIV